MYGVARKTFPKLWRRLWVIQEVSIGGIYSNNNMQRWLLPRQEIDRHLWHASGLEQSMKPMIGKSIDQSMTIDALLVNWHRLASANRWPIDNHTKVVATHRLSSIGVKKKFRYSTRSSMYVYALAVPTNVSDLNSFTGLFVCRCDWRRVSSEWWVM